MAKLKPWYQVVTPREDLRDNRPLDASEFAVHLDHIRTGRDTVSKDYADPARFFERTYSDRQLAGVVVAGGAAAQRHPGGNVGRVQHGHSVRRRKDAFAHDAVPSGPARRRSQNVEGRGSHPARRPVSPTIPKARTAVFVGTEFDAITGRKGDGEPTRKTPWGEIAWQLGGAERFAKVAQHDAQGVAPAGDVLREMLPPGPTLILMDELLNYISSGRKLGLRDQFFNFLQNLCEEARARNNLCMCISIPRSDLEMNPDDQRDHDSIKKLCDRTGQSHSDVGR